MIIKKETELVPVCGRCGGNCWGCWYADLCPSWLDIGTDVYEVECRKEEYFVALCDGRHSIPEAVDGSIFPNIVDPTDIPGLKETVSKELEGVKAVTVYVTGMTPAWNQVVKVCLEKHIKLTAMYYDRNTGKYIPDKMF